MLDSLTGGCGYYGILSSGVFLMVGGVACARVCAYARERPDADKSPETKKLTERIPVSHNP